MTDSTYDEVRRCFRCKELGELAGKSRATGATPGAMLHSFVCMNERCRNFEQIIRVVQVNPDGTIPPPITRRNKSFPTVRGIDVNQQIAKVNSLLERQVVAEKDPDDPLKEVKRGPIG